MNKRKSPGECGEFFHTVLKECGAGQHFGLESSVCVCVCACVHVRVYTQETSRSSNLRLICVQPH